LDGVIAELYDADRFLDNFEAPWVQGRSCCFS
jgi:hypothetical protein